MTNKRLILIQDDPILGSIYRDRLELAGFAVETARNSETGVRLCEEIQPDAVVLDPILSTGDIGEAIAQIRAQSSGKMPILLLPTAHSPLPPSAERDGAIRVIERSANPLSAVVNAVCKALGVEIDGIAAVNGNQIDPQWQQAASEAVPGSLIALRQALHEVMRNPVDRAGLHGLLLRTHTFAGQMAIFGENAIAHLAAALEILVQGLEYFPERSNPLTLRTLGQAVDFLATLWEHDAHLDPLDLSQAHILIVEDEPSARELIGAAMNLVGLNADGLDAPGASLAVLSTHPCDLIFLDINLPEMNGFDACTRIRALPLHERTPIVFLTGMTSFQNRVQSSLSGGNDFVGKPFNVAELGVKALIWLFKGKFGLLN